MIGANIGALANATDVLRFQIRQDSFLKVDELSIDGARGSNRCVKLFQARDVVLQRIRTTVNPTAWEFRQPPSEFELQLYNEYGSTLYLYGPTGVL